MEYILLTGCTSKIGKELMHYFLSKGKKLLLHYNMTMPEVLNHNILGSNVLSPDILRTPDSFAKKSTSLDDSDSFVNHLNVPKDSYISDLLNSSKPESLKRHSLNDASPPNIKIIKSDFSCEISIQNFLQELRSYKISAVINNAATFDNDLIDNFNLNKTARTLQINSLAPALIMQHLFLHNEINSKVINFLDAQTHKINEKNFFSYSLSKGLLEIIAKKMAKQYLPKVIINNIAIGMLLKHKNQSHRHFNLFQSSNGNLNCMPINVEGLIKIVESLLEDSKIIGQTINFSNNL